MRALLILGLTLVASASAFVEVGGDYHLEVGIPLAAKIKAYEDDLASKEVGPGEVHDRIVGGALAPVNAHPYFAGLLISLVGQAGNSVCGSTLLTANRLVTAAHCWWSTQLQAWQFVVILGTNFLYSGGTRVATSQVILHPQYVASTLNNDVAMIYLPTNVAFSGSIQPVAIPNASELWVDFVGQWATAAGFGKTTDLQAGASVVVSHVSLQVISVAQCWQSYGSPWVVQSTLCTSGAGGVGVCGGDSGGPLVTNHNGRLILIGISSFAAQNACQRGHPSGFARVTSSHSFITQHL